MTEYVGDLDGGESDRRLHSVYPARAACGRVVPRPRGGERRNPFMAGAKGSPVGLANLDNTPFLVFAVSAYF